METNRLEHSIAGGHEERFALDSESNDDSVLIKKTNLSELSAYVKVFSDDKSDPRYEADLIFRKFLP
jgi:hypothetical protein